MKNSIYFLLPALLLASSIASAEESQNGQAAAARAVPAERELVNYPPEVKVHMLDNMRGHLQTLAQITGALSKGQYNEAAELADARLGMGSETAAGCRPGDMHNMLPMQAESSHLDHQMSLLMPEGMRKLGQAMHRSANEFATIARDAAKSGNPAAPLAALGRIEENCAACHAHYRLN